MAWLLGAVLLGAPTMDPLASDVSEPPELYAVIVANNLSVEGELPQLRYADDDGARWYELLSLGTDNIQLLSVLDVDTQRRHPAAARGALTPSWDELERTLDSLFAKIEKARARGRRSSFYFVYIGHGSLSADGAGSMHLLGSYLTRRMFFERILERSPATTNHVIIDACHAYLMVASRGSEGTEARIDLAINDFIAREYLSAYPNTGVLLATSSSKEVHEWSRFQAGIFSHEVRSALIGAADIDRNRAVTYDEVEAFVAAANIAVGDPNARLEVYARPPQLNINEPVLARGWLRNASVLVVPERFTGRWWLEDERGVRFADFHSSSNERLTLSLVPQDMYYLRNASREVPVETQDGALVLRADRLAQIDAETFSRGASIRALEEGLFAVPYGQSFYRGYVASNRTKPDVFSSEPVEVSMKGKKRWSGRQWASVGLFAASVGVGTLGAYYAVEANDRAERYRNAIGDNQALANLRRKGKEAEALSGIMLGVSGGLALSALLTLVW